MFKIPNPFLNARNMQSMLCLVLGVLSIVLIPILPCIPPLAALLSLVFGLAAIRQGKIIDQDGRWFVIAGLSLAGLGLAVDVALVLTRAEYLIGF